MTDEPAELVDAWVAKNKPDYPIAIVGSGQLNKQLRVEFYPFGAVINPSGTLTYSGSLRGIEDPLDEALSHATKGPVWPKALDKPTKWMQEGQLDRSYAEVQKLLEGGKLEGGDLAQTEFFRTFLEGRASAALTEASELQETRVYRAVQLIEPFAEAEPPFPATAACQDLLAALEALPDFKREIKGGELYQEALEARSGGEYTDAFKKLKTVYRKYEGTRIAAHSLEAARELMESRLTGFQAHCSGCKQQKRACKKHHEEVEL